MSDEPQPIGDTDVPPPQTFTRELAQSGRGRHSSSPLQIPWTGWKDVLWRTYEQINEDRLLAIAAGVVFFGLLAVFPAITALVSCYGLFADASTISDNLQTLALMLPDGSFQIVQDQIARVLANGQAKLGLTFLFGLALALWSANAGVKAVIDALNVVYGEREKRSFIKLNMLSLAFTTGAIAALLLMVSAVVALPLTLDRIGLATDNKTIISLSRWPLLLLRGRAGARHSLPLWSEPPRRALGMAQHRHPRRRLALARRLGAAVLVPVEFRQLQRHLRLARRRHRPDDVDVDVRDHRSVRGRTEFRDRAPDRRGYHRRTGTTDGRTWRRQLADTLGRASA